MNWECQDLVIHMSPDSSLAVCCSHKVSLRSSIKMDFMNLRKAGLLKFYPWESELHLERNQSSHNIGLEPPMLLYTWMNNFISFSHVCHPTLMQPLPTLRLAWRPDVIAAWLYLMDVVAWHLGVAWPALLVTEVFLPSLSDASGLVPVTWPGFVLLISFPHTGSTCHVWSISRDSCLLVSIGSPCKVRRVFRYCLQDVLKPLFVSVWLKRPCDWELSNCSRA